MPQIAILKQLRRLAEMNKVVFDTFLSMLIILRIFVIIF